MAAQETQKALFDAAHLGSHTLIKQLLGEGADPNLRDNCDRTPLMVSIAQALPKTAKILIDAGADATLFDCYGDTALHHLAASDELGWEVGALLDLLLEAGADIEATNESGSTPLGYLAWQLYEQHQEASPGQVDLFTLLAERGANLDAVDSNGNSIPYLIETAAEKSQSIAPLLSLFTRRQIDQQTSPATAKSSARRM